MNYKRLLEAQDYYTEFGYKPIDVPWTVSKLIIDITIPRDNKPAALGKDYLVGSAEQSFLQLISKKELKPGKYSALTPCFRDDLEDELHKKYFMKLELINTEINNSENDLFSMLNLSTKFFKRYLDVMSIRTGYKEYDIITSHNQIELGSYGIRYNPLIGTWIFGTGLAEPRLSYCLETLK